MPIAPDQAAARRKRHRRLLAAGVALAGCGLVLIIARRSGEDPANTAPDATLAEVDHQPVMILTGDSRTIGLDHGVKLRDAVPRVLAELVFPRLKSVGADLGAAGESARACAEMLPQQYVDELDGLAEGASVKLDDLLLLQALPELAPTGRASAWAVYEPVTRGDDLVLGLAWDVPVDGAGDWPLPLAAVDADGARPWSGVLIPGCLGPLIGVNREGLGVAVLAAERAARPPAGLPAMLTARRLLDECVDLQQAVALVESIPRAGGFSLLVVQTQPSNEALVIEARTDKVRTRPADDGLVLATNTLRALREPPQAADEPGACGRYDKLFAWFRQQAGAVDEHVRPVRDTGVFGPDSRLTAAVSPANRRWVIAAGRPPAAARDGVERVWNVDDQTIEEPGP